MSKIKRNNKPVPTHPWKRKPFAPTAAQILLSRNIYDFMPSDCFASMLEQTLDAPERLRRTQAVPPTRPKDWSTSSMRNFMIEIDLLADEPPPWGLTVTLPRYLH